MLYNKEIFNRCFSCRGKRWYKNIKYIPMYFRSIAYLVKNGYDNYATWETDGWFVVTMRSVLKQYNETRTTTPCFGYDDSYLSDEEYSRLTEANEKKWNDIINRMLELLDLMDGNNPKYNTDEYFDMRKQYKEMNEAKDEFFQLFSKHFYDFWD